MRQAPKSFRLHIGIFGRRSVGKSSLVNAIFRQQVSVVSAVAGTTTDPVEKPMELLPLGPVLFIDTGGIDDEGELGNLRVDKTRRVFDRTDIGVVVTDEGRWETFEEAICGELQSRGIPLVVVFNKADVKAPAPDMPEKLRESRIPVVETDALTGRGLSDLRQALIDTAPDSYIDHAGIFSDLAGPGDIVVLVVPIDSEAPKGRLIMPQVQSIRDLLDNDAYCIVVREHGLKKVFGSLKTTPRLVVTDSQAFAQVAADTPPGIPLTSFSILFARFRGNLPAQVEGTMAIDELRPGDRILVAEHCSHHPIGEDIGRVKIPRWLIRYTGGKLRFDHVQGHDFPDDVSPYSLVVHCGACTANRRAMLTRIMRCRRAGVPITNYGLTIAFSLGIFERALAPFPAALEIYRAKKHKKKYLAFKGYASATDASIIE